MRIFTLILLLFICVQFTAAQKQYNYPKPSKDSIVDYYFNTPVNDPYQWMENPVDPRLIEWLEIQKKITKKQTNKNTRVWTLRGQLASMFRDVREEKRDDYVENKNKKRREYVFSYKYSRYDRAPDLLYKKRGKGNNFRLLIKAKDFRKNKHDNIVVTGKYVNEKHDLAAITISHSGSDWREAYIFDLNADGKLIDTLKFLRTTSKIIWQGKNVYYDRYDNPKEGRELLDKAKGQKLYYHKLGTSQSEDIVLYQNPDTTGTNAFNYGKVEGKIFFYHFYKQKSGKVLKAISYANMDPKVFVLNNFLIYPNTSSINISIEEVFGDSAIIKANWNSPNGKVLIANINKLNNLVEFIPEYDVSLRSVNRLGKDKIACIYRNEGAFVVLIFNLSGELLKRMDFPQGKKVNYFFENSKDVEYTDYCISSFFHPDLWYQLSLKNLTIKPKETVYVPYDPKSLETKYLKYKSKDGTEVPMYITCKKGIKLNGKNPTLLYGYGGYGDIIEPRFNEELALWLLHGGVLATPNIRGGGAEGLNWGKEGRRLKKQNAIDDFIAAAEYLINKKYTCSEKLAIEGASHGGLLVGAAITQRPDLFKAAIAEAGVFDMLRFGKFTAGSVNTNISEFGTVSDSLDFINLRSYSPLHNLEKGVKYPNLLLIAGDKDDRVPPLHSYKFLATLQENGDPTSLYHLYLIIGAGHNNPLPKEVYENKMLYKYYFLFSQLGLKFY